MKKYYQETAKTVLERVNSRGTGLTGEEVEKSRERCGWNELVEGKKKRIPQIFLEQYKDFLVLILIASAIISGILGDAESAAVIIIVITINGADGKGGTVAAELEKPFRTGSKGAAGWCRYYNPCERACGGRCHPAGSGGYGSGRRKAD